jgi:hypothetical protein
MYFIRKPRCSNQQLVIVPSPLTSHPHYAPGTKKHLIHGICAHREKRIRNVFYRQSQDPHDARSRPRPPVNFHRRTLDANPAGGVPTIQLTAAIPSNTCSSFKSNVPSLTVHVPQAPALSLLNEKGAASLLPPSIAPRKKLVPNKSKLGLLGMGAKKEMERDFSDVIHRVGVNDNTASIRGRFEIYVDPAEDPEIGEVIIVKQKKSRVALDGVLGESRPVADAANVVSQLTADDLPRKKSSLGPLNILKRSTGAASFLKSEDERDQK